MITLLVSSKTMVKKDANFKVSVSEPTFREEAEALNAALIKLSQKDLRKLMHISENLSKEVEAKIKAWDNKEAWPAWFCFSGDVYKGLLAETLSKEDLKWAQNKVWTLSGLYGVVRPLDGIKPYRLEAAFKLSVGTSKNLYEFWGDKVANIIKDDTVLNLSSEEYIKMIRKDFSGDIITPIFLQDRKDGVKFEAVHAKVARGRMARWVIKNRIDNPELLKSFDDDGYRFEVARSTELAPVFIRKAEGVMKIVR